MADTLHGFGLGVASKNSRGEILDVYYPAPLANISGELVSALEGVIGEIDAAAMRSLATNLKAAGQILHSLRLSRSSRAGRRP